MLEISLFFDGLKVNISKIVKYNKLKTFGAQSIYLIDYFSSRNLRPLNIIFSFLCNPNPEMQI